MTATSRTDFYALIHHRLFRSVIALSAQSSLAVQGAVTFTSRERPFGVLAEEAATMMA